MLSSLICARYREIAEHRQYRLSGYSQPITCVASDARIAEIEQSVGQQLTGIEAICFTKEHQSEIVEHVITQLIAEM